MSVCCQRLFAWGRGRCRGFVGVREGSAWLVGCQSLVFRVVVGYAGSLGICRVTHQVVGFIGWLQPHQAVCTNYWVHWVRQVAPAPPGSMHKLSFGGGDVFV